MAQKTTTKKKASPTKRAKSIRKEAQDLALGEQVFSMVKGGVGPHSFRQIAEAITSSGTSISHEKCRQLFYEHMKLRRENNALDVEDHRMLVLAQLEDTILNFSPHLRAKIGPLTDNNTVKMKAKAGDVFPRVLALKAELLDLRKPQKVQLTDEDGKAVGTAPVINLIFSDEKPKSENE